MATTRPFAYNTGSTIDGTTQIGNIAIGVSEQDYSLNPGGVKWWMGPDEDLGYVIANVVQTGDHPTPVEVDSYINFWRSTDLTDQSLLDLLNVLPITDGVPPFGNANDAKTWLNDNGHFTSYGEGAPPPTPTPTPTVTVTPTPTSTVTSTPTNTPTSTSTPTPTPTNTSTSTPTPSVTTTNTSTPTPTPTLGETPTGYSFNLVVLPYNFPSSGNTIMTDQSVPSIGTTNPNLMTNQGNAIYFNSIDSNGVDRTSYFSSFTGQSVTITMTQNDSTAIYSGNTNAFQSWINSGQTGFVFGYGIAQSGYTSGTTVTVQSAPTNWVTGQTVTVSLVNNNTITPTPTPTSAGAGGGSGEWYFYNAENSSPGAPSANGNALFFVAGQTKYSPNYVSQLQVYFNLKDSTGTDYTTQFNTLTTGGTISFTQNGNTATYTGITGTIIPNQFFYFAPTSSAQQTVTSAVPFVSGSSISLTFGNAPNVTPTTTPTPSVTSVTPTPTPTNTVTPSNTPTITPTNTVTPSVTPTNTPTNTPTPTITPSPTSMPTNVIVAAGGVNVLGYSYDGGDNWTNSSNGATFISQPAFAVATDGNMFVAGGEAAGGNSNALLWSYDGNTWSGSTNGSSMFGTFVRGIAYGGDKWVAVGISGGGAKIAYSYDGKTWSGATNSNVFGSTPLGIAYNGSRWVATAQKGGGNTNTIAYSDDGITWSGATNSWTIFSGTCWNVAWGGDKWVAVGTGANRMAYSYDGVTWTGSTSGNSRITGTGYGIAHNGSQWVAAGQGTNALAYSSDGITWSGSTNGNTIFSFQSYCVTWVGTKWVAGGIGTNQLATSTDGLTWSATTNGNTIMNNRVHAVAAKY